MRKISFIILMVSLTAVFCSCSQPETSENENIIEEPVVIESPESDEESIQLVGAFTDEDTTEIPDEAQAAFDKAYEGINTIEIKLISFRGSQVVAGMKYKFLAEVNGEEKEIIIFKDLDGNCSFFDLDIPEAAEAYVPGIFTQKDFYIGDVEGAVCENLADYYMEHTNDVDAVAILSYENEYRNIPMDWKSYRGIGLGSSADEVLAAYGEKEITEFTSWGKWYNTEEHTMQKSVGYIVQLESGMGLQFEIFFDQNDEVMVFMIEPIYEKYMGKVKDLDEFEYVMQ